MEGERGRIGESIQTKMPKSLSARAKTATKRKMRKIKVSPRGKKKNSATRAKIPHALKIKRDSRYLLI